MRLQTYMTRGYCNRIIATIQITDSYKPISRICVLYLEVIERKKRNHTVCKRVLWYKSIIVVGFASDKII